MNSPESMPDTGRDGIFSSEILLMKYRGQAACRRTVVAFPALCQRQVAAPFRGTHGSGCPPRFSPGPFPVRGGEPLRNRFRITKLSILWVPSKQSAKYPQEKIPNMKTASFARVSPHGTCRQKTDGSRHYSNRVCSFLYSVGVFPVCLLKNLVSVAWSGKRKSSAICATVFSVFSSCSMTAPVSVVRIWS